MKEKLCSLEEAINKYKENNRRYDYEQVTLGFYEGLIQGFRGLLGLGVRKYRVIDKQRLYENTSLEEKDFYWRW